MTIRKGGVYLAALDPVVGSEISKTRPVVVVSNDLNNTHAATVTIVPITSGNLDRIYPFEVFLPKGTGDLPKDSKAKADQVRTIDRGRLIKSIGKLDEARLDEIGRALLLHLDLA